MHGSAISSACLVELPRSHTILLRARLQTAVEQGCKQPSFHGLVGVLVPKEAVFHGVVQVKTNNSKALEAAFDVRSSSKESRGGIIQCMQ